MVLVDRKIACRDEMGEPRRLTKMANRRNELPYRFQPFLAKNGNLLMYVGISVHPLSAMVITCLMLSPPREVFLNKDEVKGMVKTLTIAWITLAAWYHFWLLLYRDMFPINGP